jgi:hypothetical protein
MVKHSRFYFYKYGFNCEQKNHVKKLNLNNSTYSQKVTDTKSQKSCFNEDLVPRKSQFLIRSRSTISVETPLVKFHISGVWGAYTAERALAISHTATQLASWAERKYGK